MTHPYGEHDDASRVWGFAAAGAEFPLKLQDTIGETLRLIRTSDQDRRWHRALSWDSDLLLLAGEIPVADLHFSTSLTTLMYIACCEERWRLTKDKPNGWDLNLERANDQAPLGHYWAHHWRAGGTIELADGTSFVVSRSLSRWRLHMPEAEPFVEIPHRAALMHSTEEPLRVTMKSLPPEPAGLHLAVLTVCGVILLEDVVG
jgi:hypothetical protein